MGKVAAQLITEFQQHGRHDIQLWIASSRSQTLLKSGLFDLTPRIDPRSARFDVYHYLTHLCSAFVPASSIVTLHDLMFLARNRTRDRLLGAMLLRAMSRAARIVCVSEQTHRELTALRPSLAPRATVIPWGWNPVERIIQHRQHIVAFGGSADPRKRTYLIPEILQAYRERVGPNHALPLLVFGRGISEPDRRAMTMQGIEVLADPTDQEVGRALAAAAALVYPTVREGFGLPIVEAGEVGTPVVVSTAAALTREVRGRHVWFAEEDGSAEPWVDALLSAIETGPVNRPLDLPSWSDVARQYEQIYEAVA